MNNDVTASIGARITDFTRKMRQVQNSIKSLPSRVKTKVVADVDNFHAQMDSLANKMRVFGTIAGGIGKGGIFAALPALVPVIATAAGGIGGLATALAAAGTGAIMFGAVATSALGDVFAANKKIQELRKELANTQDLEKRAEIIKQIEQAQAGLTAEQQRGLKALQSFSSFWGKFAKQFQEPVMDIFIRSLGQLKTLIKTLEPAFQGAVKAFDGLSISMGKAFKSEDMQKFFQFLNESAGPAITKLGTSFGNVMRGIMNLMTAFAPLSTDMQGGLVKLTEKFAKWSATLSESKGFENFINYVKENGPKVMALIGNLTTFLIELGKGMAPLGSKILDLVNGFLQWSNGMMKANPIIAKIIGVIISLSGVLLALTPVIIAMKLAFGGMASFIWARTAMMRAKVVTGITMMIKSLGQFIAKMAVTVARLAAQAATFIAKWVLMGAKATLNAAKMAAAWTLATGKAMAKALASMVATTAKFIAKWALMGVKALFHAAKVAAAWVIALGPVGWVIATVIALVALVIANWDKVSAWTKKAWSATVNFVKDAWSKMWGKTKEIASNIYNWVRDKFQALKDAVSDKMQAAKTLLSNIWNAIKTTVVNLVTGLVTKAISLWQNFKNRVDSITRAIRDFLSNIWGNIKKFVVNAVTSLKESAVNKFESMKDAVGDKMRALWQKIKDIWGNVMDFFRDIDLFEIGGNIIEGLVNGIKSIDIIGAVKNVAGSIKDGFVDFFKIGSPSKLMKADVGRWVTAGVGKGMIDNIRKVTQAAKHVAKAAVPQMPDISGQMQSSIRSATHQVKASVKGLSNISVDGGSASGSLHIGTVTVQADDMDKASKVIKTLEGLRQAYKAN